MFWKITTPSLMKRRGKSRLNKANNPKSVVEVAIRSVLKPYKADNIINFTQRYQATSANTALNITRAFILNTIFVNLTSGTSNVRIFAAVRVNRVCLTTSAQAALEWQSAYGPTSATVVTATSTTAPGEFSQRPAKNSLASFWSMSGSNESESLMALSFSSGDFVDVDYSAVLLDQENAVGVTTGSGGTSGSMYRSYLDGPRSGALLVPVYCKTIN
jgi:hypothetical protein